MFLPLHVVTIVIINTTIILGSHGVPDTVLAAGDLEWIGPVLALKKFTVQWERECVINMMHLYER